MKKGINKLISFISAGFNSNYISFVDVGARWGIQRPWNVFPENYLKYIGIDADEKECERLNNINTSKNIKYYCAALSNMETNEVLYLTKEEGRSSIYKPNAEYLNKFYDNDGFIVKKEIALKTTTLNQLFDSQNIKPDFIKLDTQGAELKILQGGNQYLDNVLGIEVEVEFNSIYEKQPLFSNIDQLLREKDFELFDLNRYWAKQQNMGKSHSSRGQIIFADAIYFRSINSFFSSNFSNDNERKIKFLKMISILSLYGFFDTAIEYLNHSQAPFKKNYLAALEKEILIASSYPKWQKLFFDNKYAAVLSRFVLHISNIMSYKIKTHGWGTDYNAVDGRFLYHRFDKYVKIFGQK